MSNGFTSTSALIETYQDSDGNQALARVDPAMGLFGSALQIRLVNCGKTMGCHWHARHKDDPVTIMSCCSRPHAGNRTLETRAGRSFNA